MNYNLSFNPTIACLILLSFLTCWFSCTNQDHSAGSASDMVKSFTSEKTIKAIDNRSTKEVNMLLQSPPAISQFVRRIFQDHNGHLWMGTNGE